MGKPTDIELGAQSVAVQDHLLAQAEDANTQEHRLTLGSAIKLYPKAIAWSMLMSTALVMDGYDFKLIGSLFAQPVFAKAYGQLQTDGTYQIPAAWQTGLNNGSNVGQMIGLLIAGYIVERFGFRRTMMGALVVVPCLIFIQFFAKSLPQLQAGQVLLGMASTYAPLLMNTYLGPRHSPWHIPNHQLRVCCGNHTCLPASLFDIVCQWLLVDWTVDCSRDTSRHFENGDILGLPHTICHSMVLAHSTTVRCDIYSRVSVVARSTESS